MLKHILIAVDGSPASLNAARFGFSMAEQTQARVTLLTVLPGPDVVPVGPLSGYVVLNAGPTADEAVRAERLVDGLAAENSRVKVTTKVETGHVSDTICEVARESGAELIVVGARGISPARRLLLGSISDQVTHHAHCPVVIWR